MHEVYHNILNKYKIIKSQYDNILINLNNKKIKIFYVNYTNFPCFSVYILNKIHYFLKIN